MSLGNILKSTKKYSHLSLEVKFAGLTVGQLTMACRVGGPLCQDISDLDGR